MGEYKPKLPFIAKCVEDDLAAGRSAVQIINSLVKDRIATVRTSPAVNTLRACGVTGSCTWSTEAGLLDSWRRNAAKRIGRGGEWRKGEQP